MATVRWTPEETRRRLMAVAARRLGAEPAWTRTVETLEPHPEPGQPAMFHREWQAVGAQLIERGYAGEGNPRDGWGWRLYYTLNVGEPPVSVELLDGGWDCHVTSDFAHVRGGSPEDAARLQAWLTEG